jgi:uncharacterized surface protein with fasciclin (FAS1) repeats
MQKNVHPATNLPSRSLPVKHRWLLCPLMASVALGTFSQPVAAESIQNLLESDKQFGLFMAALKHTSFWHSLKPDAVVTMFMPSDEALKNEGTAFLLDTVLIAKRNKQRLDHVMSYRIYFDEHLVPEAISTLELRARNGECLLVYRAGTAIRVGPEAVVTKHLPADNGIIFVIDRLLLPPWKGGSCRLAAALDTTAFD